MCWISKKTPKKKIATKDIVVQKILSRNYSGDLISPVYCDEIWKPNKKHTLSENIICEYNYWEGWKIERGFHSCEKMVIKSPDNWYCGDEFIFGFDDSDILCEFIIPKGSIYYKNENGVYVSNRLQFVKTL